jgi:hypothetical protein
MSKNDFILFGVLICLAVIIVIGFNTLNPDYMRYEVAINPDTSNLCYIKDWKTGEKLPVTKQLLEKADGSFYCDPSQCK